MDRRKHWDSVYRVGRADHVGWYQRHLRSSLELIRSTSPTKTARIIDVGAGASTLVDDLLDDGFHHVTVLDVSPRALQLTRERLGDRAGDVAWLEGDVTRIALPPAHYDVWHDRAVFHFLADAEDRRAYVTAAARALRGGGHLIVATFAPTAPARCSGLPVIRYDPRSLQAEFGSGFRLRGSTHEEHVTPAGAKQGFSYCLFAKAEGGQGG